MKSLRKHLMAAGLLAGLGLGAIAQTTTPPAPGAAPQAQAQHAPDPARAAERRAKMEQRIAKRMAAFKEKLKITAAQEGAWTTWTTAMKPQPHQRPDRAEFARLTTPERIDRMRVMRVARMADADKRGEATKTFYAALSADQQKVFDAESLRFAKQMHRGMRGGHHGGHHRS